MLVKIFIKRRFKKGKVKEINALLRDFRSGAMTQSGYVSGETLVSYDDSQNVLVIGTWQNMESWLAWKGNQRRKDFETMLEVYQEGPPGRSSGSRNRDAPWHPECRIPPWRPCAYRDESPPGYRAVRA